MVSVIYRSSSDGWEYGMTCASFAILLLVLVLVVMIFAPHLFSNSQSSHFNWLTHAENWKRLFAEAASESDLYKRMSHALISTATVTALVLFLSFVLLQVSYILCLGLFQCSIEVRSCNIVVRLLERKTLIRLCWGTSWRSKCWLFT